MKGLTFLPTQKEFLDVYQKLQSQALVPPQSLAQYSQWARLDPRLAEILVDYCFKNWKTISYIDLNYELKKHPWPNAIAPILEFVQTALSGRQKKIFEHYKKIALFEIDKSNFEQYFIGHRKPGGKLMFDDARFSIKEYLKWGYLSREILWTKSGQTKKHKTHSYLPQTRIEILKELLASQPRTQIKDYLEKIGFSISSKQALRDFLTLKKSGLKIKGNTKARTYSLK